MPLKETYASDLIPGTRVEDVFVVASARQAQSRNGPYWSLTLSDAGGQVESKIWSPLAREINDLASGQVVRVAGQVELYRDRKQLVVERIELLDDLSHEDMAGLVPASERDPEEMLDELATLLKTGLGHKPWRDLCRKVLSDSNIRERLLAAPGAMTVHHAYAGGLLEHTLSVCRLCMALAELYPDLDREVLLVGAAFHDLGKAWELSAGMTPDYTDEGRLVGHIVIGLEILDPFIAKVKDLDPGLATHLRHLMVSHHGQYDFGSPKRPKTAEAMALHYADMIDSKLNTVAGVLPEEEGAGAWSPYVRSLERAIYRPARTPMADDGGKGAKKPVDQLCLLHLKG